MKEPLAILAPNPSPLTGPGTTTFLVGQNHVAVIDPGPDDDGHLNAILAAGCGRITHILVTHAHRDHSALALRLAGETGAPILAFGTATDGKSPIMQHFAQIGAAGGGEGLDRTFRPDIRLTDGQIVETPDWQIRALHMPGHSAGHVCFAWQDTVFCGDLVMGWSSTLISPPDGDLGDYFRSLRRLGNMAPHRLHPTHGATIHAPLARIDELIRHRRSRSAQIMAALHKAPGTATTLAERLYDIPQALMPAAARNVLAHLIALSDLGAIAHEGMMGPDTVFAIA